MASSPHLVHTSRWLVPSQTRGLISCLSFLGGHRWIRIALGLPTLMGYDEDFNVLGELESMSTYEH